jgi:copper resistance protein C
MMANLSGSMVSRRLALLLAGAAGAVALTRPAAAHAVLIGGTPQDGASLPSGPRDLVLTFNSRVDSARSRLTLVGPDGVARVVAHQAAAADQLVAHVALTPGAWLLRWQVLAIDGHITRGDVRFSVTDR